MGLTKLTLKEPVTTIGTLAACLDQYQTAQNVHLNPLPHNPDFYQPLMRRTFKNIVGKGENAGNQHFLFSNDVFYPLISSFHF